MRILGKADEMFKIIFLVHLEDSHIDLNSEEVISEYICKLGKKKSYCNPFLILEEMGMEYV